MAQMTATALIAALEARAALVTEWDFKVSSDLDEDGDGRVQLSVYYDEDREGGVEGYPVQDEPLNAFGPLAREFYDSGMINDDHGTVCQWIDWRIESGQVA